MQRSKEYFDRKFVKKSQPHNFVVGDIVLINVKKRIEDIKNVGVQWIGPCTVVYKRPGQLYDIKYKCEGSTIKYLEVHPEFIKFLYWPSDVRSFIIKRCVIHICFIFFIYC